MFPSSSSHTPPNWTWEENKKFENALAVYPGNMPNRWETIANELPGKTAEDVYEHYQRLLQDLAAINLGLAELSYDDEDDDDDEDANDTKEEQPRRRKVRWWTEEEHRLFLQGLKEYDWGQWKEISENVVKTRTRSQVESHARNFLNRQASGNKGSKRKSVFDITEP